MSYSSPWGGWDSRSRIEISQQAPGRTKPPGGAPPGGGFQPRGAAASTSTDPRQLFQEGMAAYRRFRSTGNSHSLNICIARLTKTVELVLPRGPRLIASSNNLGVALFERYKLEQKTTEPGPDDLDEALEHLLRAYQKSPRDTPARARAVSNLLAALEARLALPEPLSTKHRNRMPSLKSLRKEMSRTPGISVLVRVRSAHESGRSAADTQGPAAGYSDLATAVELLPRALWGAPEQMVDLLAEFPGLASEAAACAIGAGELARAVQLLEHGRAILWSQHMKARSPREELLEKSPQLVQKMDQAYNRVEPQIHLRDGDAPSRIATHDIRMIRLEGGPRREARIYRWLGRIFRSVPEAAFQTLDRSEQEWAALSRRAQLSEITFVEPDYESNLKPAANEGPVVYVNVSPWHCDALIVRQERDTPERIPLPNLTADDAQDRAEKYLAAMTELAGQEREATIREILDWLWRAVAGPVLAALDLSSVSSRMWWVPTGPLMTLPLHAATPQKASEGVSVPDQVVSSYAPTLRDLIRARKARDELASTPDSNRRFLLVTPHTAHLPGTARTHARLKELLPPGARTFLTGPDATYAQVTDALPKHAWAHFDCHAIQDLDAPLQSHLSLHDRPLTISDLAGLPFTQAEFAFLAACTTAAGSNLVHDEWISLAAALMYLGFQAVIGTLWPVPDSPTARIGQDIYDHLIDRDGNSRLVHTRSASAIHQAILNERIRCPDHPSAWVSFVHYGV